MVTLEGDQLSTRLKVTNTGDKPFEFTASLHRCGGCAGATVSSTAALPGQEQCRAGGGCCG